MQVRQLGMWSSESHQYPAFSHFTKTVNWYDAEADRATVARVFDLVTNCFDVVSAAERRASGGELDEGLTCLVMWDEGRGGGGLGSRRRW